MRSGKQTLELEWSFSLSPSSEPALCHGRLNETHACVYLSPFSSLRTCSFDGIADIAAPKRTIIQILLRSGGWITLYTPKVCSKSCHTYIKSCLEECLTRLFDRGTGLPDQGPFGEVHYGMPQGQLILAIKTQADHIVTVLPSLFAGRSGVCASNRRSLCAGCDSPLLPKGRRDQDRPQQKHAHLER